LPNAEATSPAEDGLLQAWEIRFKHHLKADLVTVAACETGKSKALFNKGPDLPMSLLYAGARSVIAPLSRVDDTSTAFLMLEVHKNIHAGLEKDEALRAAMVATRKKPGFEHPYYWGAFELFGATQNGLVARN